MPKKITIKLDDEHLSKVIRYLEHMNKGRSQEVKWTIEDAVYTLFAVRLDERLKDIEREKEVT